jgi:hypothetical protein
MKTKLFLLLYLFYLSANADVYKCKLASGVVEYQAEPCPLVAKQVVVPIKPQNPIAAAKAEARFSAWQAEQERQEAIKLKEQKEYQAEVDRQLAVQALQRSAWAQEKQAAAAAQPPVIINQFIPNRPYFLPQPHHEFPHDSPPENSFQSPHRDRFSPIIDNDPRFAPFHDR